mgnify:CR=1 FL=1
MKNKSISSQRHLLSLVLSLIILVLFTACFEAKTEIKIHKDGSGSMKGEYMISERMVVALDSADTSGGGGMTMQSNTVIDEASMRKQLGEEVNIVSLEVKDNPDGTRLISYEIEAEDIISYLNKQKDDQMHGVRVVRIDENTGALEFKNEVDSGNMDVEFDQLYGLVKGLFVETTIHLPVTASSEFADVSEKGRSVTWTMDLRNREGLERAKEINEKLAGKNPVALFSLAEWDTQLETLPSASLDPVTGVVQSEVEDIVGVQAELAAITSTHQQKLASDEQLDKLKYSRLGNEELELHVLLTWDEDSRPINFSNVVLEQLVTDNGESLIKEGSTYSYSREINDHQDAVLASVKTEMPSPEVKSILLIKGYVPIVAEIEVETVLIENPESKIGEGSLEDEALKLVGGYLKKVSGKEVSLVTKGDVIESIFLVKANGERLNTNRSSGSGNDKAYTRNYTFSETVEADDHLELTIRVSEVNAKVPFEMRDIPF